MKFFYDYFQPSDVCGIYTWGHLFTVVAFVLSMVAAFFLSRKMTEKGVGRLQWIVAIAVTVMEIVKIALKAIKGDPATQWMPLYYCSIFIVAIWLTLTNVKVLTKIGYAYICMGGILASLFFSIYPSTSLGMYPLWHPSVWHSFVYHWLMFYTGVMIMWKKGYKAKPVDSLYYLVIVLLFSVISMIVNPLVRDGNGMFLGQPFALPIFLAVYNFNKGLYIAMMVFAQGIGLFWLSFGLDLLVKKLLSLSKTKKQDTPPTETEEEDEEVAEVVEQNS
ncbi:MAG: YwaF family protein [Clostridia bacterium]|nr:YwaF family protein [Clostridia bacterium]